MALLDQKLLAYTVVDVIPRQDFVEGTAAVSVKRRVYAALLEDVQPFLQIEAVAPAVKMEISLACESHRLSELSVTACEYGLEKAGVRIVVVKRDFLCSNALLDVRLLLAENGNSVLRLPLEGCKRLRNE